MATEATNLGLLNGNFKIQYADKIENLLVKNDMWAQSNIKFVQKNGKAYQMPVLMSYFNGITANDPSINDTAYDLEDGQSATMPFATVSSAGKTNIADLTIPTITRSLTSAQAYAESVGVVAGGLYTSTLKAQELSFWYGKTPYASFAAQTVVPSPSTEITITLSLQSFAESIFKGAEKTRVQIFDVTGGAYIPLTDPVRIKTANLDASDPKVVLVGSTGDIAAIAAAIATGTTFNVFFYNNAEVPTLNVYNEGLGYVGAISSTTPYFGLDPSVYNLWKGNVQSMGNVPLTFDKAIKFCGKMAAKSNSYGGYRMLVNPNTYSDLITQESALRRYNGSEKSTNHGFSELTMVTAIGELKITQNAYIKNGLAMIFKEDALSRVGSTEVTFNPVSSGNVDLSVFGENGSPVSINQTGAQFFQPLESKAGYRLRTTVDNVFFVSRPSDCGLITNITPSLS